MSLQDWIKKRLGIAGSKPVIKPKPKPPVSSCTVCLKPFIGKVTLTKKVCFDCKLQRKRLASRAAIERRKLQNTNK